MILKEKTFTEARDWKQAAGDAAEKEMAFYLRRYFGDDAEVYVLNDIRLEMDGDAAQMDHVLIHPAGLTIIESKSVAGKLQMKADGEWLRWYDDRSSGMASPIVQAKLQAEFLRKFLRRMAKQPQVIDALAIDFMIAISSKGQFIAPKGDTVAEVCKADLVGERIRAKVAGAVAFPAPYRKILGEYMSRMHTPRAQPAPVASAPVAEAPVAREPAREYAATLVEVVMAAPASPLKPATTPPVAAPVYRHLDYIGDKLRQAGFWERLLRDEGPQKEYVTYCKACASQQLEFRYGKYGYYLKCLACGENTGIKLDCRLCGRQARLRKESELLYVECEACKLSELLHRNDRPLPNLP
ncbi:nuclease-related domain-containing protein [Vogesella indigofera]|uniref:NERD domain-containing protein n=1 Tax=Vogesella indigofera TaxID=45465 RepID=A0ABT5I4P2_VOGIN|nr:NERD domain-containing protein [Vogesella indigofera]MDC7691079.1 NERD domain-containing protein [Vogesella indigofera]